MTTIVTTPDAADDAPRDRAAARMTGDVTRRAAGVGALTFVSVVIAQNLIRAGAPMPGDDISTVIDHFADHRPTIALLLVGFVAAIGGLATFLGGTMRTLLDGPRRGWAVLGGFGVATVIALFTGVVATEQALAVVASSSNPDPATVEALWAFHNSLFTVNLMFIGVAVVGLSRAGIAAGITPRPFRVLAPVGAGLLALGTMAGPYVAAGDGPPIFGISVLGFVVWLAFLATTGVRLLRARV